MSLYYVQKLLYQLNRDPHVRQRYDRDLDDLLRDYELTEEERHAISEPDIGLLYVLGVNGQILMHYAAMRGFEWDEYIQAMRHGIERHGPVREGLYAMTDGKGAGLVATVFLGAVSHAPGITGRADRANAELRDDFYANLDRMRQAIEESGAEALIVVGAEHFANFFMDNMPAYCIGMADSYHGPIEDAEWLGIEKRKVPGNKALSRRIIKDVMKDVDVAYAEEWKFDHGIMVPLHFLTPEYDVPIIPVNVNCQGPPLTPLHRAHRFGEALREACDRAPERIAVVATGGISHWPATPDSGKINEVWDREFLDRFVRNDTAALLSYTDEETYRDAGQGGFEIRTFITLAGAAKGGLGELWFYAPIPIFAVGCTVVTMSTQQV